MMRNNQQQVSISQIVLLVLACALLFVGYLYVAPLRLVARDEGFYLYAARLITEGKHIYLDFFYPQAPLLPYVYSIILTVFGTSWEAGRMGAGIITACIGSLLVWKSYTRHSLIWAFLCLLLYAGSHFVLAWFVTVQTYSLSVLFLLGACLVLSLREQRENLSSLIVFLGGLLFGLSICTRLFFAGLGPLWCLWILCGRGTLSKKTMDCLYLTLGCCTALVIFLPFVALDYENVYFNNLGYHFIRSTLSPEESVANKIRVLQVVLGLVESIKFDAPQLAVLVYLSFLAGIGSLLQRKNPSLYCYTAFGLFALNFLPSPTYVQYFCTLVPFLILCTVDALAGLAAFFSAFQKKIAYPVMGSLILVIGGFYFYHLDKDFIRYTYSGDGVIGIRTRQEAKHWNLRYLKTVSDKLDELEATPSQVVTPWPGYLVASRHHSLPGLENHFALLVGHQMSDELRARLHIVSKQQMVDAVAHTDTRFVLLLPGGRRGRMKKALEEASYGEPINLQPLLLYRKPAH